MYRKPRDGLRAVVAPEVVLRVAVVAEKPVAMTEWTGTATDLLGVLGQTAGERISKAKAWPDSVRALAGRLRRAATFLRKVGIDIGFEREGRGRARIISITTNPAKPRAEERGRNRPHRLHRPRRNTSLCPNDWTFAGLLLRRPPTRGPPVSTQGRYYRLAGERAFGKQSFQHTRFGAEV